ncbi:MAG TPA: FHIPEP family type III secretion protein [Spirochaetota bacterium]|nr:FHIPEP family type III secretion protein [Spirochaetota bacterium]
MKKNITSIIAIQTLISGFWIYYIYPYLQFSLQLFIFSAMTIAVISIYYIIYKGGVRISEVTYRFKLDSMPGKFMKIDADLNRGVISVEEAENIRASIKRDVDNYGTYNKVYRKAVMISKINFIAVLLIIGLNLAGILNKSLEYKSFSTIIIYSLAEILMSSLPLVVLTFIIVKKIKLNNQYSKRKIYTS